MYIPSNQTYAFSTEIGSHISKLKDDYKSLKLTNDQALKIVELAIRVQELDVQVKMFNESKD